MASPLDFNAVLGAQLRDAAAQMRSMRTPPHKDTADIEDLPAASDADILPDAQILAAHSEAQPVSDKEQTEQETAAGAVQNAANNTDHIATISAPLAPPPHSSAAHAVTISSNDTLNSHEDSAHDCIDDSSCDDNHDSLHAITAPCTVTAKAPPSAASGPVVLPVEPPTIPNELSRTLPKGPPETGAEEDAAEEEMPYTITKNMSPLSPDAVDSVRQEIAQHTTDADASAHVRLRDIHLARSMAQEVAQNRESQVFDKHESDASAPMPAFLREEMPAFMSQPFIPQQAQSATTAMDHGTEFANKQTANKDEAANTGQDRDQDSGPLLSNKTWSGGVRGAVLNALRQLAGNDPEVKVNLKRLAAYADLSYGSVRNAMSQLVRSGDIRSRQIRVADGHGVLVRFLTTPETEGTARPLSLASTNGKHHALSAAQAKGKGRGNAPAHHTTLSANAAHSFSHHSAEDSTTAHTTDDMTDDMTGDMTEQITVNQSVIQTTGHSAELSREYLPHNASPHSTKQGHASFWETDHALFALAWPNVAAAGLTMEGLRPLAPVFAVQGFDVQILPRCLRYLDWQLETMEHEGCSTEERDAKVREFVQWLQRRGTWPKPQGYEE